MEGCAFLLAGFGQDECAGGSAQPREFDLVGKAGFGVGIDPAEAACDHEVDDERDVVVAGEDKAFAEGGNVDDAMRFDSIGGWIESAKEEGGANEEGVDGGIDQPRLQAVAIGIDVREFGHGAQ